jgi:hypothetical protein
MLPCGLTHLFEYNLLLLLLPYSWFGELELSRGTPFGRPTSDDPVPIGILCEPDELDGGSIGEVAAVEEPDRG